MFASSRSRGELEGAKQRIGVELELDRDYITTMQAIRLLAERTTSKPPYPVRAQALTRKLPQAARREA